MGNLREISSKILTLSYPKYRVVTLLLVLALLAITPVKVVALTHELSICSRLLGKFCFSVGITRGVSSLLKGNFQQAMEYNFLSVIVLSLMVLIILLDIIKIFKERKKR